MLHPVKPYYTNLNHLKPIQGFNQELKKFLPPPILEAMGFYYFHRVASGTAVRSTTTERSQKDCTAVKRLGVTPGLDLPKHEMGVFGKFRKRMNRNGDENCLANTVIYKSQELFTISSLNPYYYKNCSPFSHWTIANYNTQQSIGNWFQFQVVNVGGPFFFYL